MGGGWLEFIAIRRVYMGLCGQGSRGRGISAIGGWQWGMGSRPRFHGGRLFAGTMEGGMGPRIREDNEGKGNCRNGGMSGKREEGGRARMRDSSAALGMICGRWGKRTGMDSRRRLHGGRISTRGQRGEGQL